MFRLSNDPAVASQRLRAPLRTRSPHLLAGGGVLALLFVPQIAAAQLTFTDTEFADADWTAVKVTDTSVGMAGVLTASQAATGGNPDAFRFLRHDFTGPGSVHYAHLKAGAQYTPSVQGPLTAVTFECDAREIGSSAVSVQIVLRQNGSYYFAVNNVTSGETWEHFENAGMTATAFDNRGGFGTGGFRPDFSSTGSTIEFGFSWGGGSGGSGARALQGGVDNWKVTLLGAAIAVAEDSWGAVKALFR